MEELMFITTIARSSRQQLAGTSLKKFSLVFVWTLVITAVSGSPLYAQSQVDLYIAMLRTDLTAQKAANIVSNMNLTEAETEAFWPVYRQYQKEMDKVGDAKVAGIKEYAAHMDDLGDKQAEELIAKALNVEEQRLQVIKKYIGEFDKVLSAKQVARFFQLEMQMQRMVDLQVAAQLPLVK